MEQGKGLVEGEESFIISTKLVRPQKADIVVVLYGCMVVKAAKEQGRGELHNYLVP